jgi:hypothetical protein
VGFGSAIGITTVWPVLLGVAVGLAVWPLSLGRVGAYVLGAVVGWVAMAMYAGFLPHVGFSARSCCDRRRAARGRGGAVRRPRAVLGRADRLRRVHRAVRADVRESPTLFLSESPGAL